MIDKCCRFRYTKIYILMNMSAECAFCFLINLKIQGTFILTEQQTKIQLVSSVHGLTAKLSQGLNLLDSDIYLTG
jgi:hypothetical protein